METPKHSQDTHTAPGSAKRAEIDMHNGFEIRHWAKEFDVSAEQIIAAVKKVGPAVDDVRRELKREGL